MASASWTIIVRIPSSSISNPVAASLALVFCISCSTKNSGSVLPAALLETPKYITLAFLDPHLSSTKPVALVSFHKLARLPPAEKPSCYSSTVWTIHGVPWLIRLPEIHTTYSSVGCVFGSCYGYLIDVHTSTSIQNSPPLNFSLVFTKLIQSINPEAAKWTKMRAPLFRYTLYWDVCVRGIWWSERRVMRLPNEVWNFLKAVSLGFGKGLPGI